MADSQSGAAVLTEGLRSARGHWLRSGQRTGSGVRADRGKDRGAAAVEFALVMLFALVPIVVGIAEFGRAYNVQLTLTAAAREGVRVMAIDNDPAAARAATRNASTSVTPAVTDAQIAISPTSCAAGGTATLTISYQLDYLTGLLGDGPLLTGKGVMRCNG